MAEPIEIGMLCGKGDGHAVFDGDIEYGSCGSHKVGMFNLSLNIIHENLSPEESFDEYELLEAAAEYIANAVMFYDEARRNRMLEANG